MIQTNLDEWETVRQQIEHSKIKRYPYKKYLGVSLTKYILRLKENGLSSSETFGTILHNINIQALMFENPDEIENIEKNIYISVSARFAEENTRGR
jgi:hypothetical protein